MSRHTTEQLGGIQDPNELARAVVRRVREKKGALGRDPNYTHAVLRLARYSETDDALRERLQEALLQVFSEVEEAPDIRDEWPVGALLVARRLPWDHETRRQRAANRVLGLLQQQVLSSRPSAWRLGPDPAQAPNQPSAAFVAIALAHELGVVEAFVAFVCNHVLNSPSTAPADEATARELGALLALRRSIARRNATPFDRSIETITAWPPHLRDAAWSTFPASVRGLTGSTEELVGELTHGPRTPNPNPPSPELEPWRRAAAAALSGDAADLTGEVTRPTRTRRPAFLRVSRVS